MTKYRILLADDSTLMREFIKGIIADSFPEIDVHDVSNGKEAQHKLENARYDFILCDWEMPEMSGSALLEWIRDNPTTKTTPFIMVTARREKEAILEAIKLGVSDYIVKPLTPEVLYQKIKTIIRKLEQKSA